MATPKERIRFMVMQCPSCGAPLHYDASIDGFACRSCGGSVPYKGDDGVEETSFSLLHIPLKQEGKLLDLSGLGEQLNMARSGWNLTSNDKYSVYQKYLGHRTRVEYGTRKMFSHRCPMCGGDVQAFETQTVWSCGYCGNQFVKEEVLAAGGVEIFDVVDNGDPNLPHFAIPFEISRELAKRSILDFAAQRPRAFAEQDLDHRVDDLLGFYLPYQIADVSLLLGVSSEKGDAVLFQDRVNWAVPLTLEHSIYMMNDVGPWDLSRIAPFARKFVEGDVLFDKTIPPEHLQADFIMENLLRVEVLPKLRELYPGETHSVKWLRREVRSRRTVMLPLYFLDRGENGPKVWFMVNGQTGAVCAMGRGELPGHKTLFSPGKLPDRLKEPEMVSPYYPVVERDPGFYEQVEPQEAFVPFHYKVPTKKKKRGFFAKLFDR